jgi:hypothetical protein
MSKERVEIPLDTIIPRRGVQLRACYLPQRGTVEIREYVTKDGFNWTRTARAVTVPASKVDMLKDFVTKVAAITADVIKR